MMPVRLRWSLRTLLIAIAVAAVALFGVRLYSRWSYHKLCMAGVSQYQRMAEATRLNAEATRKLTADLEAKAADQPDGGWAQAAAQARRDADLMRRQAEYYDELAKLTQRAAARPWYESDPVALPPALMHPPDR